MAATIEYSENISCNQAISWSRDNRIAICTDSALKILTVSGCTECAENSVTFRHSIIPASTDVWDIPQYSDDDYQQLLQHIPIEDEMSLVVDGIMNSFQFTQNAVRTQTGYRVAAWSPQGADVVGRSVLATVSHDFRLCIYSQLSSQYDWYKVCDLSELRVKQQCRDREMKSPTHFHKYRNWCHSQANVVASWCPVLYHDSMSNKRYCILVAGTRTGLLVGWRINMPCVNESDCVQVFCECPHQSEPIGLTWRSHSGELVVAYEDGQIHIVGLQDTGLAVRTTMCLHPESDLVRASCMCFVTCQQEDDVLLVNKEQCVVAWHLDWSEAVRVVSQSHIIGDNTLAGCSLSLVENQSVMMSSLDGLVQCIDVILENAELKLSSSCISTELQEEAVWLCFGLTISPSKVFVAYVVRRVSGFDHLDKVWKCPTRVHIRPFTDLPACKGLEVKEAKARLLDDTVSLYDMLDVLELYRIQLLSHMDPEETVNLENIHTLSLRELKLKRYALMLQLKYIQYRIKLNIPGVKPVCEKTHEALQTCLLTMTREILFRYAVDCISAVTPSRLAEQKDTDLSVLSNIYTFLTEPSSQPGTSTCQHSDMDSQPETSSDTQQEVNSDSQPGTSTDPKRVPPSIVQQTTPADSEPDTSTDPELVPLCIVEQTTPADSEPGTRMVSWPADNSIKPFIHQCCICSSTLKYPKWICSKGHNFDICLGKVLFDSHRNHSVYAGHRIGRRNTMCCITMAPCEGVECRSCTVCSALSLPLEKLKGCDWLPNDPLRCTLCEMLLL